MTVSIPCASCLQQIRFGQRACPGCSRRVSSEETAALESRFEATHVDFRDAKAVALRGLTAALVAGLMTMTIAGLRVFLTSNTSDTGSESPPLAPDVSVHRDPRIVGEDRGMTVGAVHRSPARIWARSGSAG
jgi:hypothetical protein